MLILNWSSVTSNVWRNALQRVGGLPYGLPADWSFSSRFEINCRAAESTSKRRTPQAQYATRAVHIILSLPGGKQKRQNPAA